MVWGALGTGLWVGAGWGRPSNLEERNNEMKFRVAQQGKAYKIQRRRFFWWKDLVINKVVQIDKWTGNSREILIFDTVEEAESECAALNKGKPPVKGLFYEDSELTEVNRK
jgi:hypothetical protein